MMDDIRVVQGTTKDGKIVVQFYFLDEWVGGWYLNREFTQEELQEIVDNLGTRVMEKIDHAIIYGIESEEKTDGTTD